MSTYSMKIKPATHNPKKIKIAMLLSPRVRPTFSRPAVGLAGFCAAPVQFLPVVAQDREVGGVIDHLTLFLSRRQLPGDSQSNCSPRGFGS